MAKCIHHWVMGASLKGIVHAKCRKCGAEKDYFNFTISKYEEISKNKEETPNPARIE